MGWIDVLKAGITSVGDDIARSNVGQRIANNKFNNVVDAISKAPDISADEAMKILAKAQVQSDDFYKSFVAQNGVTPDDFIDGINPYLYKTGRGLAHTGNFLKNNAAPIGMNALFMSPMILPYVMQPDEQQQEQGY